MFSYPLLHGDVNSVLVDKNAVVLSENFALRLFGTTENVVGKSLEWEKGKLSGLFQITGIFQEPTTKATSHFDLVFNYDYYLDKHPEVNRWVYGGPATYIQTKEGTDPAFFNEKIRNYLEEKSQEDYQYLFIRPYSDKYLYSTYINGEQAGGRMDYVKLFALIAFFILVIACINFMNLSTAKATRRMKEVGVKKTIGASRGSLIGQYLSESVLISFIAFFVAVTVVNFILPFFNELTGKYLVLEYNPAVMLAFLGITLFTGLLSGSYPALYLSRFKPAAVLKGDLKGTIGELLARKGLVVFQFAISVILIVSVLVVYQQVDFIQSKNLGYNKDNVIILNKEGKLTENLPAFLEETRKIAGVVNASTLQHDLTINHSGTTGVSWEGLDPENRIAFKYIGIDYELIETLDIEMAAGRSFSKDYGGDTTSIIFNETAIKSMGITDPVGKMVRQWGEDKRIIGVAKDFHFESLYEEVKPCFIHLEPNGRMVAIKIKAGREKETLLQLEKVYGQFNAGLPLEYRFLDESYQRLYDSETKVAILSKYFAGLAILISCLGLFGLAAYTAQRRWKEIGIRKVLGASELAIVQLLSKDFTKMVLLANVIALPLSYWVAQSWLGSFAFSIGLSVWWFVGAGVLALLVAWVTVGMQTVKAARVNPVECLKME